MRKTGRLFRSLTFALALAASSAVGLTARAQDKEDKQDKKQDDPSANALRPAIFSSTISSGPPLGVETNGEKGSPYSAEMVSESIQILYDGNRIVNRSSTTMYRDSQGRTRNESSFKFSSLLGAGDSSEHKTISIFDPVGKVTYMLDPQNHTARKFEMMKGMSAQLVVGSRPMGGPTAMTGIIGRISPLQNPPSDRSESLGTQMIEGVEAEGRRITQTIPAGAMGNDRVIETVIEQWYSPELKLYVLTKTTDPRYGESTQRLTNLNRNEPDASLFQVPADYKILEDQEGVTFSAPLDKKPPEKQ